MLGFIKHKHLEHATQKELIDPKVHMLHRRISKTSPQQSHKKWQNV